MTACSIEGCDRRAKTRGWCNAHYRRWLRHGDPSVLKKAPNGTYEGCIIEGCDRPHHARGMCGLHLGRIRYHGDPLAGGHERLVGVPIAERFWSLVQVGAPDECWSWMASVTPNGYGQFFRSGRLVTAHRVALELHTGSPVRGDLDVDHVCHTLDTSCTDVPCAHRRCCNPLHLEAVTHRENVLRGRKFARTGVA